MNSSCWRCNPDWLANLTDNNLNLTARRISLYSRKRGSSVYFLLTKSTRKVFTVVSLRAVAFWTSALRGWLTISESTFGLICETMKVSVRWNTILNAFRSKVRMMLKNWFLVCEPVRFGKKEAMSFHLLWCVECKLRSSALSLGLHGASTEFGCRWWVQLFKTPIFALFWVFEYSLRTESLGYAFPVYVANAKRRQSQNKVFQ